MRLGWKVFLPLSLAWLVLTASYLVFFENYLIKMKSLIKSFILKEIVSGLIKTYIFLFKKKATINYPFEKGPISPRFRGVNMLLEDIPTV